MSRNQKITKGLLRTVATVIGLLGVGMVWQMPDIAAHVLMVWNSSMFFALLFTLLVGCFFVYVGYLNWFKFSDRTVRLLFGELGFCTFLFLPILIDYLPRDYLLLLLIIFPGWIVVAFVIFKALGSKMSRWLFRGEPDFGLRQNH